MLVELLNTEITIRLSLALDMLFGYICLTIFII